MRTKSDMWQVAGDKMKGATRQVRSFHVSPVTCHSRPGLQPSRRGVALIITLILLSVVTFMAVTFLALSRRERNAVATVTDTAGARFAADAALANAEAQIMANVLSTTNPFNFGLLVSTNYISGYGYNTAVGANPTNVNYFYPNGTPVTGNDFLQLLENLYYSPRPPVFFAVNSAGTNDFRYYLDLNRNGRDDPNGMLTNYDNAGNTLKDAFGNVVTNFQIGDPEWIGVLERPDAPYGPNNKFIARYAFIALPAGNTLDLNAIHNQVFDEPSSPSPGVIRVNQPVAGDAFFRNQGVGSWEINLAAFLADLNTNEWGQAIGGATWYQYNQPVSANLGRSFEDARALLAWRYNNDYNLLSSVGNLFGGAGNFAFLHDNIDGYSDGPLQTTFDTNADFTTDRPRLPWAGADNTNHFFTHQELFAANETGKGVAQAQIALGNYFSGRLLSAGNTNSTYDRYTFYRLLSQLGTDTTPDSGRMNLNYDNLNPYLNGFPNSSGVASATNFVPWQPLAFFTNAADRLLRAYTARWRSGDPTNFAATFYSVSPTNFSSLITMTNPASFPAFGIANIPVWVSNRFVYSPAVNRLLQLAANMYDATTNNIGAYNGVNFNSQNYPSVFRPLFSRSMSLFGTNLFISGYTNVILVNMADADPSAPLAFPLDAVDLAQTNYVFNNFTNLAVNVYGVPWIIGAKKGFPNFNELAMENAFQLTRKLQVTRTSTNANINTYQYNQMYILGLTNALGVECWNSYNSAYTNTVNIYAYEYLKNLILTNDIGFATNMSFSMSGFLPVTYWPGDTDLGSSFKIPLDVTNACIPYSMYRFNDPNYPGHLTTNIALPYENNVVVNGSRYPQPHWWLMLTNNLRLVMLEPVTLGGSPSSINHVIDYVQLRGPNSSRDLTWEILNLQTNGGFWLTNTTRSGQPYGVADQLGVSLASVTNWLTFFDKTDPLVASDEVNGFRVFFQLGPLPPSQTSQYGWAASTNFIQAPYTPTAKVVQHISWQANDPLVHYINSDLIGLNASWLDGSFDSLEDENLGRLNHRYMPWGGNPTDLFPVNSTIKDPLVRQSDDWNFPTNKLPGIGWLGRVHRGTPWQTVYLKAMDFVTTNLAYWSTNWTGNVNLFDAANTAPVGDRLLFDLFTTAFNDNATRGTLSVNVGPTNANLAAWSALFSGMVVPTNLVGGYTIVNPAGVYNPALPLAQQPPLVQIVDGINQLRATFTNADGLAGTFEHAGDILAAPQLTEQSPFLAGLNPATQINDEMFEWLPQQALSLLRCSDSPRYVIYCYGQALKPAPNGIYSGSGAFFGMVTNYQVVSEIATRAVVRFNSALTNRIVPNVVFTNGVFVTVSTSVLVVTNNNAVIESFNLLPPD